MKKIRCFFASNIDKLHVWAIIVCIILLIVDILFKPDAPVSWLVPAWTADGFLSFVGAVTLGYIAFWQNKRYKELSDKATDLALMPEIYIVKATSEVIRALGKISLNRVSIRVADMENENSCHFSVPSIFVMKAPIIDLRFTRLKVSGNEYKLVSEPLSIYSDAEQFSLSIYVPKEVYDNSEGFCIECTYENLYGTKYKKTIKYLKIEKTDSYRRWIFERSERA